jgi:AraC-like DNA-binding protein
LDSVNDWAQLARQSRYDATKLAAALGISISQLRRFFQDLCCCTTQEWLNELRLWHALEMVCAGTATKVVAVELNFGGASHFCRQFRDYHKRTPRECFVIYKIRLASPHAPRAEKELWLRPWQAAERALVKRLRPRRRRELNMGDNLNDPASVGITN